ncbi:condensation domain-containing protein [Methylobacterium sp. J-068]|uniref:condensation domain-containing protein n=1 Tax=Methylobacterium sp. J-068 TaxID=2836649 RepID=UPI001FBB5FEB|nr:TauD/TfdA family dioxygenase [Methylobacterium sp. J-068]MCJ2036204.1 AMP-binding protein [Methylobacterium sp. J-068]
MSRLDARDALAGAGLVAILRHRATVSPEATAVTFLADGSGEATRLDYAGLDRRARAVAVRLRGAAAPGERALIALPSGLDYVAAFFGCLYAGIVAVPSHPPESPHPHHRARLALMIADMAPRHALTDRANLEGIAAACAGQDDVRITCLDDFDWAGDPDWLPEDAAPESLALLQYTSGSTANPKGVEIAHANIAANSQMIREALGVGPDDVFVSWLPLFHDMGLIVGLIQPIVAGVPLVLMSPLRFLARPTSWLEAIRDHGGTISGGPDFAYRLCCDRIGPAALARLDLARWRVAYSGAEPIRAGTLARFSETFAPAGLRATTLHPGYGLAEATLVVTSKPHGHPHHAVAVSIPDLGRHRLVPASDGQVLVSSGRPLRPEGLRIVDPETREPCPDGSVGEIWLSGASVARGYWRNPEATARSFAPWRGAIWLRTGDLGALRDGELFVTGRLKDLVILRGHNVYPQDVELALEAGVAALRAGRVAVFAVETPDGEGLGVAAEIGRGALARAESVVAGIETVLAEGWREPAALVALLAPGTLPRTTSGKLRRSACRDGLASGDLVPLHRTDRPASAHRPPSTPETGTETRLAAIFADLLAIEPGAIRRGDTFLGLGGHSLLALRAVERIRGAFGVDVSLRDLFAPLTLADLAARLEAGPPAETPTRALPPIAPAPEGADSPSLAQQRLWLAEHLGDAAERSAYNMTGQVVFDGPLSHAALGEALRSTIRRHAILRTAYRQDEDGLPRARIADAVALDLPLTDLSGLPPAERAARLAEAEAAEARTPFDLTRAPLLRARLMRLSETEHRLVVVLHHLVGDGWSVGLLLTDLGAGYRAATGLAPPPTPLPVQYRDYAHWQRAVVAERGASEAAFWRDHLAGTPPVLPLPTDAPRPPIRSQEGASLRVTLPGALVEGLSRLGRAHGASPFMVLLAGFEALLARATGAGRFVVGTDVAGRPRPELAGLIGFFVNVLPLRARIEADDTFARLLGRVRDDTLAAFDHALLPFDGIVEAVGTPRDRSRPPLVQALFVMQTAPPGAFGVAGLTARPIPAAAHGSKFEMALFLDAPAPDGVIAAEWVFARTLFRPERIARLAAAYAALLERALASPDAPLCAAPLPPLEDTVMSSPVSTSSPAPSADAARDRLGSKLDKLKGLGAPRPPTSGPREPARLSTLRPGAAFPLVVEPLSADVDAVAWASRERDWVEAKVRIHAGLLFRGFGLTAPQEFEAFAEALHPGLYGGYGDLPKNEGGTNTYRSTPYPEREMILYHNESSHLPAWPRKQWFFCQEPSPVGGATPIVDGRELHRRLPRELAERFARLGLLYVRTFTERFDVDWRRFFHTDDRTVVEARCRAEGVDFTWIGENELQTRTRCPAVITHPITGETAFFNQVQLHHTRCLDPEVRADLLGLVGPERMPRDVRYGDGSPIEDAVMDEIGRLYEACAVRFDWRVGDVVMLDNMLAAHARDPYEGPRRIVVAMGDMVAREALPEVAAR